MFPLEKNSRCIFKVVVFGLQFWCLSELAHFLQVQMSSLVLTPLAHFSFYNLPPCFWLYLIYWRLILSCSEILCPPGGGETVQQEPLTPELPMQNQ